MKKLILFMCLACVLILHTSVQANNISVSNVALTNQNIADQCCYVNLDLSWDNSWRISSTIPYNWDAAWVFVKYRVGGGEWQHATLNYNGSSGPGGAQIDFSLDNKGAFVYRSADGSGSVNFTNMSLRWDYGVNGVNDDALMQVKVFAVEMVYIPQGSFYLGDAGSTYRFFSWLLTANPFLVDNSPIVVGNNSNGELWATGSTSSTVSGTSVPDDYPTGYDAYYCFKYEISQQQYVDFLNTLTRDQQNNRVNSDVTGDAVVDGNIYVMSASTTYSNRNGIACQGSGNGADDPITFYCDLNNNQVGNEVNDGQNIPCNYINWMDVAAYADWAALRPITESEFEKMCRGPNNPIANEFAWGSVSIASHFYILSNEDYDNEIITNPGINTGNAFYNPISMGLQGPLRCGIYAASATNHNRVESGSGYYGNMELSFNLAEMVVVLPYESGLSFTGLDGDGELTSDGYANTDYWPGINGNSDYSSSNGVYSTSGVTHLAGAGERGGDWGDSQNYGYISNRISAGFSASIYGRLSTKGGRLGRTAP